MVGAKLFCGRADKEFLLLVVDWTRDSLGWARFARSSSQREARAEGCKSTVAIPLVVLCRHGLLLRGSQGAS